MILSELFNDPDESHAFMIGMHCGLSNKVWQELYLTEEMKIGVQKEYPYYLAGLYGCRIGMHLVRFMKLIWRK